jgi:hypothetical protein
MTDATATLNDVTSFVGRILSPGGYRRVISGDVIGLGAVATACLLITTVTVAAAWMINTALSTNTHIHATAPKGPETLALAKYDPILASAADVSGRARVSTGLTDAPDVTFETRWARATASVPASAVPFVPQFPLERANNVPSPPPHPLEVSHSQAKPEIAHAPGLTQAVRLTPAAAPASPRPSTMPLPPKITREWGNNNVSPPAFASEKRVAPQQTHNKSMSLPGPDSRAAVYDIAAHTVYLPNGERLEAHSGLADKLDDPRYINVRMRGPTPPNVYELALREQLFHGVRAIRLNPVDDGKMFGRDGMLAHTYMLGANGQSNGCVSFRDYQKFLQAFLRGEVERLVVVTHLGDAPLRTARARRGLFRQYASNNQ